MKTRNKILIIAIITLVVIAFFVPEVFLIFHIEKYETSQACDALKGEWDWYSDTCRIGSDDEKMCKDIGGTLSCSNECGVKDGMSPFRDIFWGGCLDLCTYSTCEFEEPDLIKIKVTRQPEYVYLNNTQNDDLFSTVCEAENGTWNYDYHDCEGIQDICEELGGMIKVTKIPRTCTGVCLDKAIYRISCVFPNLEN